MFFKSLGLLLLISIPTSAKVFLTLPEALESAFPKGHGCQTHAESKFLTPDQSKKAKELAGVEIDSSLIVRYPAVCGGQPKGYAYTDTHRVRTHPETLFIVVSSTGEVQKVEVLSFDEPLDYIPKSEWYETFNHQTLNPDLQLKRKIPVVTGASLTSGATLKAIRRVLAIHQVLSAP